MAVTSLEPIPGNEFGYAQAQHLLNRAGFGGTPQQILSLQQMGLNKAVDFLVDYQGIDDHTLAPPHIDTDIHPPADSRRTPVAPTGQDR